MGECANQIGEYTRKGEEENFTCIEANSPNRAKAKKESGKGKWKERTDKMVDMNVEYRFLGDLGETFNHFGGDTGGDDAQGPCNSRASRLASYTRISQHPGA